MEFTLGLDVAKHTIDVCLLQRNGSIRRTKIANARTGFQQLTSWLHGIEPSQVHACLEPTGRYSQAVSVFLLEMGYPVSQVNSYAVLSHGRSKGFRNKNDKIDAYLLADYCAKENPPVWIPAEQSRLELRDVENRITDLNEMIRQEKNRLEAGVNSIAVREQLEEHIAYLTTRKEQLEKESKKLAQADPVMQRNYAIINSIIGLGERSSLALLAYIQFERFDSSRKAGCFAGLTPRQYRSGTTVYKPERISRVGSNELRRLLFFPALVAIRHNPQMRAFAERLKARGKVPKVIICAVMRKLIVLAATLVNRQEFYDATKDLSMPPPQAIALAVAEEAERLHWPCSRTSLNHV